MDGSVTMSFNEKNVKLYVITPELIPNDAEVSNTQSKFRIAMPCIVSRSCSDVIQCVQEIHDWFMKNINTVTEDGYLLCSQALPALSLDRDLFTNAIVVLGEKLREFDAVEGVIFVPASSATRDAKFAVADFYSRVEFGSSMAKMASFKNHRYVDSEVVYEETQL